MLSLKLGCNIKGIQPEIILGACIVADVLAKYGFVTEITEATGAKHMQGSLHYKGLAVDIHSKSIISDSIKYKVLSDCVHALGVDFDMIIEDLHKDNEHFHLEFDPK